MQYDPVLENLVGTLFLSPTGIPALTKARFFLVSDLHGLSYLFDVSLPKL